MRIQTVVSSAALFAALLTSSSLIPDAYAQQRVMLSPTTDWAISKVADRNGRGNDYCALARRFNQNTILTFAKNHNNEASLALDFQRPGFSTSQTMKVTLDPGAGQQRTFNSIRPVSSKAFVVRLGSDTAFFSALERTGFLRIEVAGKSYGFDLSDITAGSFRLSSCLATMVMPAAGDEMPSPQPQQQVRQAQAAPSTAYRQEINGLRHQLNKLREENKKLSSSLDDSAGALVPVLGNVASEEIASLSSRVFGLEKENKGLRGQLSSIGSQSGSSDSLLSLKADNKGLRAALTVADSEAGELRRMLDAVDYETTDVKALRTKIKNLEGTNSALALSIQSRSIPESDEVGALKAENKKLQTVVDAQTRLGSLAVDLKSQIRALKEEKDDLNKRLKLSQNGADMSFSSEVAKYKAENEKLQTVVDAQSRLALITVELKSKVKALKSEKEALTQTLELVQVKAQAGFDVEIDDYKEKTLKLQAALDKQSVDYDLLQKLRLDIVQVENEHRLLQETAVQAQADLKAEKKLEVTILERKQENAAATHKSQVTRLENEVAVLGSSLARKDALLVDSAKQLVDLEVLRAKNSIIESKLRTSIRDSEQLSLFKDKLAELEVENKALKKNIVVANEAVRVSEAKGGEELVFVKSENDRLRNALETEKVKIAAAVAAEYEGLEEQNELLMAQLDDGKSERSEALNQLNISLVENLELQGRLEAQDGLKDELRVQIAALNAESEKLNADYDIRLAANEIMEDAALAKLEQENDELKARLEIAESSVAGVDVAALKKENKEISAALEKTLVDLVEHEQALEKKERELVALATKNIEARGDLGGDSAAVLQLAALQGDMDTLQEENSSLKARIVELGQGPVEFAAMKTQIDALTSENEALQLNLTKAYSELKVAVNTVEPISVIPARKPVFISGEQMDRVQRSQEALRQADIERQNRVKALSKENRRLKKALDSQKQPLQNVSAEREGLLHLAALGGDQGSADESIALETAEPIDAISEALEPVDVASVVEGNSAQDVAGADQGELPLVMAENTAVPIEIDAAIRDDLFPVSLLDSGMSEAQKHEAALVNEIHRRDVAVAAPVVSTPVVVAPVIEQEVLEPAFEPVIAQRVEDAFEGVEQFEHYDVQIEEPDVIGVVEDTVAALGDEGSEAALHAMDRVEPIEVSEPALPVEFFLEESVFDEPASLAAVDSTPIAAPALALYKPAYEIEQILSQSNIVSNQNIEFVEHASDAQRSVYQWKSDNVYGSAEQKPLVREAQFEEYVLEYLERTEARCKGDFAVVPDDTRQNGDVRADSYEVACIGDFGNSSASLLFFNKAGTFTVLAHEASAAEMETAMDMRDRVLQTVSGS